MTDQIRITSFRQWRAGRSPRIFALGMVFFLASGLSPLERLSVSPGLLERGFEAVQRVGVKDVARLQTRHRLGRGE